MTRRTDRVAALIRQKISRLLLEEVADPSLQEVQVTCVRMTGDLKRASVFFTSNREQRNGQIERGLKRALPFIRKRLADLKLRYVPELSFREDKTAREIQRVLYLIEENHSKEVAS